jgi:hypothetical protein
MKKVLSGQPLSIPAADYNQFVDAAEWVRKNSINVVAGSTNKNRTYTTISFLNSTAEPLLTGFPIGIGDPVITPTDNIDEFNSRVVMNALLPDAEDHFGRFAIVLTDTPVDDYGVAVIDGVIQCLLNVTADNTDYTYADLVVTTGSATSDPLEPVPFGSSKILWKDSGVGADIPAIIQLNSQSIPALFCATADEDAGTIQAKVIDSEGHVQGRDFEFLVVEYVAGS